MTREDKEAIIRRLEAMYGEAKDNETKEALFYSIEALKEQRPHGTWESKNGTRYCSNCKKMAIYVPSVYGPSALLTDFCPKCGANMRQKEGDAE